MFRTMRRHGQQLTPEACKALLKREKRGVLSVTGENGYPYGMPVDHWYNEQDGKLYFHGAKQGHRLDAILKDPRASYCVIDRGTPHGDGWSMDFESVIVFGKMEIVEDEARKKNALRHLTLQFTGESYYEAEWEKDGARVLVSALVPEHITGKRVHES